MMMNLSEITSRGRALFSKQRRYFNKINKTLEIIDINKLNYDSSKRYEVFSRRLDEYMKILSEENLLSQTSKELTQILLNNDVFDLTTETIHDIFINRGGECSLRVDQTLKIELIIDKEKPMSFFFIGSSEENIQSNIEDKLLSTVSFFFKDILLDTPFALGNIRIDADVQTQEGCVTIESVIIKNPTIENIGQFITKNINEACVKYGTKSDIDLIIIQNGSQSYTIHGYFRG
jgi:hypothetical protein